MKKLILFAILALLCFVLPCQVDPELPPIQAEEQPQVQAEEPPAAQVAEQPPAQPQGRELKKFRFPAAFIHAGKEYPAGDYWLVLSTAEGRSFFIVQDAQKAVLFEELAIVKTHPASGTRSRFHVDLNGMKDSEYFRVKVTTQREWLLGYFLVKK